MAEISQFGGAEGQSPDRDCLHTEAMLADALDGLRRYTPARAGDRTLMDALEPFLAELQRRKDVVSAARCAREGAESTRGMLPRLGRTVYIEQVGDIPDPGAVGIAELVEGLAGV